MLAFRILFYNNIDAWKRINGISYEECYLIIKYIYNPGVHAVENLV